MDLLEQCQKWHENDEYQKIIDALEAIPEEERTPETDMELARAYNSIADPREPDGADLFKRAISLLKPHEEHFAGDHCWNFRMGYAYYYLDQEGRALPYFRKALEARPGDEDTQELIDDCESRLSLPNFRKNFRQRTAEAWKVFVEQEAQLRQIMDEDKNHERGEELIHRCGAILDLAFDDISFEMGHNGEEHELILTPEGNKVKLFELVYFQKHAPEEVLEHWSILVGRQPAENIGLRTNDWEISGEDVQIWLEDQGENSFGLSAYCEKLLPMLQREEGRAWWMLITLTDQVLGEIPHMRYIDSFDVLEKPKAEPSILLSQLPDKLCEKGLDLSTDPESYLESYIGYSLEPDEDPDADWRLDTLVGSTCCASLINGYLSGENGHMDDLHADGAVAGFLCYPLDGFTGEDRSQQIFDLRDALEEALTKSCGPDAIALTGGATGLYCGYVDFIAWDLFAVLNAAKAFFEDTDLPWASFHVFRRDAVTVRLKKPEDEDTETEEAADEPQEEQSSKGAFAGFVLLSEEKWDKAQLIRDLKEKWDIEAEEGDEDVQEDSLVFEADGMIAAISLMPYPIPGGEAEANAANNYMWPEAVEAAKAHKAHIMVAVLGNEEDVLEKGKLYTKLAAACCRQEYATGVYTSGVVFEPQSYEGFADMMHSNELPIFNWIWFGLYRNENGLNAYTYGMDVFGRDEMEVLGTNADPNELRDFLASLVAYVLECDVTLQDGETIGFTAEDKHTITRSPSVSLPEEQMTLKISYAPIEGGLEDGEDSGVMERDDDPSRSNTQEPSELAQAMMDYLDCACTYFPPMKDDAPIMSAYRRAKQDGAREGFVPVLVSVDEILWECLVMNSGPDDDGGDEYSFDPEKVAKYREKMLAAPLMDGKAFLNELICQCKENAEENGLDWEEDILGEMEGGGPNDRFASCWDLYARMTHPLILAKIPVDAPWKIFAYLPFGNWNECPDTPELMAAAKYWFEQYGAVPASLTHDELEFDLSAPIPKEKAMETAIEQYGFCPDVVDQGPEGATVGSLADILRQSKVWYFWWD